jgi:hypothetical protein
MSKTITTNNGDYITRVSRWIRIQTAYNITERHALHYYAENTDVGNAVDYFTYGGTRYALARFLRFGSPWLPVEYSWTDDDGKMQFLSGYDSENYYNPIMIEIHPDGEHVRVYREGAQ